MANLLKKWVHITAATILLLEEKDQSTCLIHTLIAIKLSRIIPIIHDIELVLLERVEFYLPRYLKLMKK